MNIINILKSFFNKNKKLEAPTNVVEEPSDNVKNLSKLKSRLEYLKNNLSPEDKIEAEQLLTTIDELDLTGEEVEETLQDVYMEYEILNRRSFLENMFTPTGNSVITSKNQFSNMLLHFFEPTPYDGGTRMGYIEAKKREIEARRGKGIDLEDEELKKAIEHFDTVLSDKTVSKEVVDEGIMYRNGEYIEYDSSKAAAQISLQTFSSNRVTAPNAAGGFSHDEYCYALGYDKNNVGEEDILVMADKNLISLKGVNNLESENSFEDFSATLQEMNNGHGRNDEIIVNRNATRPSYLLFSVPKHISVHSEDARAKLLEAKQMAENIGVKLVILDQHSIFAELEKRKENDRNIGIER